MDPIALLLAAYLDSVQNTVYTRMTDIHGTELQALTIDYQGVKVPFQHQLWRVRDNSVCSSYQSDLVQYSQCTVKAKKLFQTLCTQLSESDDVLSFAREENGKLYSSVDAFHCWIETDNNFIDFTSPEYREALIQAGSINMIQRKMLQKAKSSMSKSPYDIQDIGDFYFEENADLTNQLLSSMLQIPATRDLVEISTEWHKRSKKKLLDFDIANDLGERIKLAPIAHRVTGSW